MKYYIQFFESETMESLGSEGSIPLDGRKNLFNLKMDAFKTAKNLKNVHTFYGFKIMRGNDLRGLYNYPLTDLIKLDYENSLYLKKGE